MDQVKNGKCFPPATFVSLSILFLKNKLDLNRFALKFDGQYQKKAEVITGRVMIRVCELAPPPPPPLEAPPPLLLVSLLKAKGLNVQAQEPLSPYVEITFGNHTRTSSLKDSSVDPVWNEDFRFNIHDWSSKIKVVLNGCDTSENYGNIVEYGTAEISIAELTPKNGQESW